MEGFKHVSNTWLVAQIINPFIIWISIMSFGCELIDVSFALLVLVFGFLFSVPGYLLCILLFKLISGLNFSIRLKFFIWLLAMTACIIAGVFIICIVFFNAISFRDFEPFVGFGIASAILAACIRFKQFASTIIYLNCEPDLKFHHENLTTP